MVMAMVKIWPVWVPVAYWLMVMPMGVQGPVGRRLGMNVSVVAVLVTMRVFVRHCLVGMGMQMALTKKKCDADDYEHNR